ncbi:MAG: preprotein translocase subunit SecG [Candidatus Glassbacteria bacterium]|nr:preprotein translocase subunit SecG [Candidatus Glassbacteria bacterium]
MYNFILVFHIIICLLLVIVILLQAGKGGGLASAFGGSGTTEAVFGGRQAATFLSKATNVLGTLFFISSFGLALISSYTEGPRSAVQEQLIESAPRPVPVTQPVADDLFQEEPAREQSPAPGAGGAAQP